MLDEKDQNNDAQNDADTKPAQTDSGDTGDQAEGGRRRRPRRAAKRPAGPSVAFSAAEAPTSDTASAPSGEAPKDAAGASATEGSTTRPPAQPTFAAPLFQPPPEVAATPGRGADSADHDGESGGPSSDTEGGGSSRNRKRKRVPRSDSDTNESAEGSDGGDSEKPAKDSGGRGKDSGGRDKGGGKSGKDKSGADSADADGGQDDDEQGGGKRRRRRRRRDEDGGTRKKSGGDEVTSVKGSTRIEAKRQRRREGRESGHRRAPVLSEAEFLARREAVERSMFVRERGPVTQIAVLEDDVLVEHYVNKATATSQVGNVYLGRVQNVLPSMEAAFVDIGRGRNAVLYAGEVNWDAAGLEGQGKRIEKALSSGDKVLVQVTKDPVGHKGARLTSQVSLPGRFVVLVPDGSMTGISRKLPDRERSRLRAILKEVVPEGYGVIVRTAAEGATEEDLTRDVEALNRSWEKIQKKAESGKAPSLLHSEPDLALRIVRDIFNSDFTSLVVSGDQTYGTLKDYVAENAPALSDRVSSWTEGEDLFAAKRIDEQLAKALDRKVYLPSGGSLVIDRTEAMTVVDVNTGRFTGQGGNLEETVTKNNLEAAEEVVRQLRLRDVGGIIVVDFIDMVLESNRDLVVRRLVECLGRDRTKHQVAEVTSLGLVQMTRKRIGQGLMETFSEPCECCNGRGEKVHIDLTESRQPERRGRSTPPPGAHDPAELLARKMKSGGGAAAAAVTDADEAAEGSDMDEVETSSDQPELDVDGPTDLQDSDLVEGDVEAEEIVDVEVDAVDADADVATESEANPAQSDETNGPEEEKPLGDG